LRRCRHHLALSRLPNALGDLVERALLLLEHRLDFAQTSFDGRQ